MRFLAIKEPERARTSSVDLTVGGLIALRIDIIDRNHQIDNIRKMRM